MTRITRLIVVVWLGAVLMSCAQELKVSVTFDQALELGPGTPVYLGDLVIGEVSRSTIASDATEVEMHLDPDLAAALNSGSAALLTTHEGKPSINLYNYRPGEESLQGGGELVGLNNSLEFAAWRTGEALDMGKQSMDELTESATGYFESEEWQQQKAQMNDSMERLKEELGRSYEETNEAYRKFLENLESESEAARERAGESLAQLAEQLKEEIARLKQQGNEKLVEPLLKLLEDLSRAMDRKPEQVSA